MINYLAWIANLGVVPLFLFFAFLLVPAAFFLFALLIDVTAVLETMVILLPASLFYHFLKVLNERCDKLANIPQCVKIFIPIFMAFLIPSAISAQSIIKIPIGKEVLVEVGRIAHYSVKNPSLLDVQYLPVQRSLKIKAHAVGVTEIEIIESHSSKKLSKTLQLNAIDREFIYTRNKYSHLLKQYQGPPENEKKSPYYELSPTLKKEIWAEIQKIIFQSNYQDMQCSFESIFVQCFHRYQKSTFADFQKELSKKYFISFVRIANNTAQNNFIIKLKLISLENSDGLDLHLGLDELSGSLKDFFQYPLKEIVGKNSVLLNKTQTEISLLGEPVFSTLLEQENSFSIGQEIPFRIKQDNGKSAIQFRFAGLSLKLKAEESGNIYKITYSTELTKPEAFGEDVAISGNKQNGAVVLGINEVLKIFEIEFQTDQKDKSLFPGLSEIPLIGHIFTSKSNRSTRKKIIGLITLLTNENEIKKESL